jgi:hypothetical protein
MAHLASRPPFLGIGIQIKSRMGGDFLGYFQRLEILAFFSGFPLLYSVVYLLSGVRRTASSQEFFATLQRLLPYCYALVATFFVFFISAEWIMHRAGHRANVSSTVLLLQIWGSLGIFFWMPALRKVPAYSLFHSLVFFVFLLMKDLLLGWNTGHGRENIRNDMNIFTTSLQLYLACLAFVYIVFYIRRLIKSP